MFRRLELNLRALIREHVNIDKNGVGYSNFENGDEKIKLNGNISENHF